MKKLFILTLVVVASCKPEPKTVIAPWVPYDETEELAKSQENESSRMQFKRIQSVVNDKNDIWAIVQPQIEDFGEEEYEALKPLILETDIPSKQASIKAGDLTYEQLVKWYLYRIVKFENDSNATLHTIITINPDAVAEAKERDKNRSGDEHPIYGMPVLLKDNINTANMPTTAGAHALKDNRPEQDAFIVSKIKEKGGIILGKLSLSEWANFICSGCPNGYSAVGGQTLNPYGRIVHDTGGSSSGSGTSMAANYSAAAVGTETSGSILSPSSSNSVVGLKPTIGLLSRGGIVPISTTLDTPGPMTRNVTDNAILLSAMTGEDADDKSTVGVSRASNFIDNLEEASLEGMRFGVIKRFLEDTTYYLTVQKIEEAGAILIEIEPQGGGLPGFLNLLNGDMKEDLPAYIDKYGGPNLPVKSVADVVEYNLQDTVMRLAYNQKLFEGIVADSTSLDSLNAIKQNLNEIGTRYLRESMEEHNLDAILSINNWSAGYAAVAKFPALTVPMGYTEEGRPMGITFIAKPFEEGKLLRMGYAFEQATKSRKLPEGYE